MLRGLWIILILSSPLALAACGNDEGSASSRRDRPVHSVQAMVLEPNTEPARLEVTGEVAARNRVEVASKVAGRIVEIPVTEGTPVEAGDLLVRLDAPELVSALAQARAGEEAARLEYETAQRQAERYRRLAEGEVVTSRDLELALVAESGARASYERARASREMNERNLTYAQLRAPHKGVVVRRLARAGDLATPGRALLVIEDTERREVRVTLPAGLAWPVSAGDRAEISLVTRDETLRAMVDRVTPTADRHTIEAFLHAEGLDVPSGTYVKAVLLGEPVTALRVPPEAQLRRGPLTGVFTVQEGRASLRWVRLTTDGRVQAGLSPGDSVVLAPPADLENGDRIEVSS